MRRNLTTRRSCIVGGLAAILAARHAPAALLNLRGGMMITGASLPYKARLEYIQGDGSAYINTGTSATTIGGYSVDFQSTVPITNWECAFAAVANNSAVFRAGGGGSFYVFIDGSNLGQMPGTYTERFLVEWKNGGVYKNSTLLFSTTKTKFSSRDVNVALFGYPGGGNARFKMYHAKFYGLDGTTELHSFIPVLDNSDTPCMYDEVTGAFFYNAGTGAFTAGPVAGGGITNLWQDALIASFSSRWCDSAQQSARHFRSAWKEAA